MAYVGRVVLLGAMLAMAGAAAAQMSSDFSQVEGDQFHSSDGAASAGCCPTQDCQNARLRELMAQRIESAKQCVAARATPCNVQPDLVRPPLCPIAKPPDAPGSDTFGSNAPKPGGSPAAPPAGRPLLLKGTIVYNDCVPVLERQQQAALRKTGNELLDTMAGAGQMTDRALNAMGQAVLEELAYLAQPNAAVWSQRTEAMKAASQAVVDYLANDDAGRAKMLREAAEKALDGIRRDPPGFVGRTASGILTGKATFVSGSMCKAAVGKAQKAVADGIKARKAAEELKALAQAEKEFKEMFGGGCGNQPGPLPPNRLNPLGRGESCAKATWADTLNDEIGSNQFDETHFHWDGDLDQPTPWNRIFRIQEETWGDRQFAGMSPERARLQAEGRPAIMPHGDGMQDIISELEAAGDGASGIVTIRRVDGSSHMFRAKNIGGRVLFRDSQTDTPGGYNFDPAFNNGPIRWSALYRTSGPDQLSGPPAPHVGGP